MGGYVVGVIADVLCILDHEAGVVGYLEPLHASDQLCPGEGREWGSGFSQTSGLEEQDHMVRVSLSGLLTIFQRTWGQG